MDWSWPVKGKSSPAGGTARSPSVPARASMQNKANLNGVSSLKFEVSSRRGQASNHPASHLAPCGKRLMASARPVVQNKANLQTACCAKQSQFPGPVGRGRMTDHAKQSQFSGSRLEAGGNCQHRAKQSQFRGLVQFRVTVRMCGLMENRDSSRSRE